MTNKDDEHRIDIIDTVTITSQPNKTLLETLEAHNVDVQYHCREGFCGACRTKILSGDVDYTTDPLAFIDDDEILPCCCKPNSNITIKITP
ncbi:MAG: class I ribonucleotide reductase maintenance protein YfaE [Pseudomonadota bacterium]|jgi:ferredoxin|uniref:class I ribonucleotide reductase maintenance protein YfaE n=2 Tax=Marisediminitalea TaxID=2662254 RepID=UPI000C45D6E9|nr:class I ribonucleotide reductase maintenance protein YfaE [Marisediminitalea aggregata]MBL53987.1 FeS-binding protein [Alteromonadaceae bacterium]MCP3862619.1 2Fe-2S ferredoxin-like protein [Aestuariibacter sp.]MEC8227110.1 class I ribonucleotide reductase maintenance protein YfaE [Pseudomonadota bacterium]MCP4528889.1 2Fe-2S ferredoxin-like protein [Aestuariibacter sp.]MCP9478857.1 class I ribonucleotide reductase maintenance protein YfaE [Marisediminitalea aggregata]|tara:strand:- start:1643 stop:1915 length:273 start_codon:yes stop_codon:yes gene_type:complete